MTKTTNSKRLYKIAFAETDDITVAEISLDSLMQVDIFSDGADYQWKFALWNIIDEVMDLQVHEKMPFLCNRDDKHSYALILRIR